MSEEKEKPFSKLLEGVGIIYCPKCHGSKYKDVTEWMGIRIVTDCPDCKGTELAQKPKSDNPLLD